MRSDLVESMHLVQFLLLFRSAQLKYVDPYLRTPHYQQGPNVSQVMGYRQNEIICFDLGGKKIYSYIYSSTMMHFNLQNCQIILC